MWWQSPVISGLRELLLVGHPEVDSVILSKKERREQNVKEGKVRTRTDFKISF